MLPMDKPKQTQARQTVKPISKLKNPTTLPLKTNNTELLITLLVKLLNND